MIQSTLLKNDLVTSAQLMKLIAKNRKYIKFLRIFDYTSEIECKNAKEVYRRYGEIQKRIDVLLDGALLFNGENIEVLKYSKEKKKFCKHGNRQRTIRMRRDACEVCGNPIERILEIHHIVPRSCGGTGEDSNFSIVCPTCHRVIHRCIEAGKIDDGIHDFYASFGNAIEELEMLVQVGISVA